MIYDSKRLREDSSRNRIGLLLTNTGTPDAPTRSALRSFLAQFLSDSRVVDWPRWIWIPILHGIILRLRSRRVARRYQRIWTKQGSPLLISTRNVAARLQEALQAQYSQQIMVAVGMRYGTPSIAEGLQELQSSGVGRILILPLFPQYTAATTASSFDAVFAEIQRWRWMPELRTVNSYHAHPAYIRALVSTIQASWEQDRKTDRLLFSFHGIPESQLHAGDPYYHQCQETASLVAQQLDLAEGTYQISFQSNFGPQEWLKPYTGTLLRQWAEEGIGGVGVICPGFSCDCLETLYEIKEEARQAFKQAGGKDFSYIDALNDRPEHIQAIAEIILPQLEDWLNYVDETKNENPVERLRKSENANTLSWA